MTSTEMNELLSNAISNYAPSFGRNITKKAALRLATSSIESKIQNISGDTYTLAKAALCKCGTILEENDANKTISGIIPAGIANMNPSFIVLWIERDTIHIKASAKEGLIRQHTAEQAVEIFESALDAHN